MAHVTKIYGPPGTGKTTRLIQLVKNELERGVASTEIGYLAHTTAARDVVRERLGGTPTDWPWVRTIHSACAHRLGIERVNIVDAADKTLFSKRSGFYVTDEKDDGLEEGAAYMANNFSLVLRAYDVARLTGKTLDEIVRTLPLHPCLAVSRREKFLRLWNEYKDANGLFDFTDMLQRYADGPIGPLPVKAMFLDEGQDLSNLQWRAFDKLAGEAERTYMAGDDDQGIYGFMGGSEFGFLDYKADTEEVLTQSHRVPAAIGERATRIIRRVGRRREKDVVWKSVPGAVQHVPFTTLNLPWRSWLDSGKTVLILSRHRKQALEASKDLTSIGVPHSLGNHSLQNSSDAVRIRDFLLLRRGDDLPWRQTVKLLEALGLGDQATALRSRGVHDRNLTVSRRDVMVDWDHRDWAYLLSQGSPTKLQRFRQIGKLVQREGIEVIGREPQIGIMTMHAAKGREADIIVIIPDCNETVRKNLQTPSEIRLAYVSLTRAKEKVMVLAPTTSRWITHLVQA